jgi:hypothetical protein
MTEATLSERLAECGASLSLLGMAAGLEILCRLGLSAAKQIAGLAVGA